MGSFLTAEQLAQELSLKPATIKRWAQEKIIPCLRLSAKVVRFDPIEVENALKKRAKENETCTA
jgi:predicted site-specific integrase-resolvase